MKSLSHYLRKKRFFKNLTQEQAARIIGIAAWRYNELENGKTRRPRKATMQKIAEFLEMPYERVLEIIYEDNK